jgi:hypothetical protein
MKIFGLLPCIVDGMLNIGCQLWIDLSRPYRWLRKVIREARLVRLDEHEEKIVS